MSRVSLMCLFLAAGCLGNTDSSDGSSPLVSIDAPANNATVGGQVSIDITAVDDFGVDQVKLLIDGELKTTMFTAPFHYNWNTQPLVNNSQHVIRVEALDVAKNVGTRQITVTVQNGVQ